MVQVEAKVDVAIEVVAEGEEDQTWAIKNVRMVTKATEYKTI